MLCDPIDPDDFRSAVDEGVAALQKAGADVVLINLQYSPRTETMISAPPYLDNMRVVAQQHEVPLFDRFAIMRHWNDAGDFDLFSTSHGLTWPSAFTVASAARCRNSCSTRPIWTRRSRIKGTSVNEFSLPFSPDDMAGGHRHGGRCAAGAAMRAAPLRAQAAQQATLSDKAKTDSRQAAGGRAHGAAGNVAAVDPSDPPAQRSITSKAIER